MITYVVGDLFRSPAQVLVNTVNTVGVMGKGIAQDFKRIYPEMFSQYQMYCERGMFDVGQLWIYKTSHKWVLNFPTKKHWRNKSKPEYIEAGLKKFVDTYDSKGITSISFPLLGCGNGELDWENQVRPLMERYLKNLPIDVYIHLYEKNDPYAPEHRNISAIKDWLRGEPESLAFSEFWEDLTSKLNSHSEIQNLQTRQFFDVSFVKSTEEIAIQQKDKRVNFNKEVFQELWQYIRNTGFCMGENLPLDFAEVTDEIVSLLTILPYIHPVLMTDMQRYTERIIGLHLIPEARTFTSQHQLLDEA